MTRFDLVVFVEGRTDRYFYSRIATVVCEPLGISYQVRSADELGAGGGKPALLAHFARLRRKRALRGTPGRVAAAFFYLDKDLDDIRGAMLRSAHVAYTSGYHVENYFFREGDILQALASATYLDPRVLKKHLGNPALWRENAARAWIEWVYLCAHSAIDSLRCPANYHSGSLVHRGCYGGLLKERYEERLQSLRAASGLTVAVFDARHREIRALIDSAYARGAWDEVFPGKWYRLMIAETVSAHLRPYRPKVDGLAERVTAMLQYSLPYEKPWSTHLRSPLCNVLRKRQHANQP